MLFLIAVVDMEAGIARTPPPGPPRPRMCPGLLSSSWGAPASPSSARVTRSPTIGRTGRSLLVSGPFFLHFGPSINNVGSFKKGGGGGGQECAQDYCLCHGRCLRLGVLRELRGHQ